MAPKVTTRFSVHGCPCDSCQQWKGEPEARGTTPADRALASLRPISGRPGSLIASYLCQGDEVLSVSFRPYATPPAPETKGGDRE